MDRARSGRLTGYHRVAAGKQLVDEPEGQGTDLVLDPVLVEGQVAVIQVVH